MASPFPAAVIFDLDGTLVDTAPDLTRALNHVLTGEGCPPVTLDAVRHMVGHGARHLMLRGLEWAGRPATDDHLDRLLPRFLSFYADHIADESVLFPHAREVLENLAAAGVQLAICTNKPERLTHDLVRALNIDGLFPTILGGDSLAVRKPDPEHLLETVRRMGAEVNASVMVGDSINDIKAARGAGLPVIGVTFGYTDVPVRDLNPDIVIEHFAALPDALRRLMA